MRPFRSLRNVLVLAAGLPLMLGAVLLPTAAWAKGSGKPVQCRVLDGHDGSTWSLLGCNQETISGTSATTLQSISVSAPPTSLTIVWGPRIVRGQQSLHTTFSLKVTPLKANRDHCTGGSEYVFRGLVQRNSFTPGVKGHLKWYVCDTGGVIHDQGSNGKFPKPLRF